MLLEELITERNKIRTSNDQIHSKVTQLMCLIRNATGKEVSDNFKNEFELLTNPTSSRTLTRRHIDDDQIEKRLQFLYNKMMTRLKTLITEQRKLNNRSTNEAEALTLPLLALSDHNQPAVEGKEQNSDEDEVITTAYGEQLFVPANVVKLLIGEPEPEPTGPANLFNDEVNFKKRKQGDTSIETLVSQYGLFANEEVKEETNQAEQAPIQLKKRPCIAELMKSAELPRIYTL